MRFHFSRHKVLRIHFVNNLYSYSNTQARLYLSTWRFGVMSAKSKNTALRNDFLEFFVARPFRDLIRLELYKATILLWPTSSLLSQEQMQIEIRISRSLYLESKIISFARNLFLLRVLFQFYFEENAFRANKTALDNF